MSLYKNKYRVESTRLKGYDYAQKGFYFVTICAKDKELYFGDVVETQNFASVQLSEIGKIANKFWLEIPNHFPHVKLDYYVVMPNHVHGIIVINNNDDVCGRDVRGRDVALQRLYHGQRLYTGYTGVDKKYNGKYPRMSKISPKPKSLSTIIRSYKSIVSKIVHIKYSEYCFAWQTRFHDHVIRNDDELNRIRQYIINNPKICLSALGGGIG